MEVDDDMRQVLEICKDDYRTALRIVLIANRYYEEEIKTLRDEASAGYGREKIRRPRKRQGSRTTG